MKTYQIILIFYSFFLFNCSSKKEVTPATNFVNYKDKKYDLNKAYIESFGINAPGQDYNIDINLFSSDITVLGDNMIDSVSGSGNQISIQAFSSNTKTLDIGEYIFNASTPGKKGTFESGFTILDLNKPNMVGFNIIGGKFTVVQNTPSYIINFSFQSDDGNTITGNYTGAYTFYNLSEQ